MEGKVHCPKRPSMEVIARFDELEAKISAHDGSLSQEMF